MISNAAAMCSWVENSKVFKIFASFGCRANKYLCVIRNFDFVTYVTILATTNKTNDMNGNGNGELAFFSHEMQWHWQYRDKWHFNANHKQQNKIWFRI